MSLKQKVKELETRIDIISAIYTQLLKELGYKVGWREPIEHNVYISKIKVKKEGNR